MPQNFNFANPIVINSSGLSAQSCRYWAYATDDETQAEVPIGQAHHVRWTFFTGKNQTGTNMGTGTWSGVKTATQEFGSMTIDQIIAYLYPPPGTDN